MNGILILYGRDRSETARRYEVGARPPTQLNPGGNIIISSQDDLYEDIGSCWYLGEGAFLTITMNSEQAANTAVIENVAMENSIENYQLGRSVARTGAEQRPSLGYFYCYVYAGN
jgi:hypothetical protein